MTESAPINPNGVGWVGEAARRLRGAAAADGPGFGEVLKEHLAEVNGLQIEAEKAVRGLMTGKADNLHGVIVAMSEADLSFRLMMQMRNKLLEAYKEIMRMQV